MRCPTVQKIAYLNGKRFQRGLLAGVHCLIQNYEYLNNINVFPVADGDTGSNMVRTMKNVVLNGPMKEVSIGDVTKKMAESILMSARGNSGNILAQFICGFSECVRGLSRLSTSDFISAAVYAAKKAREAIAHPKDGTILSVIQDWVEHLKENAHCYFDFIHLLEDSLKKARISLHETREKLEVLRSAKVVDAGAQGFIYLLEGILDFTQKGSLASDLNMAIKPIFLGEQASSNHHVMQEISFLYCVECLFKKTTDCKQILKEQVELIGDSLVIAETEDLARIHVHTNSPDKVFDLVEAYGSILQRKVENMQEQHSEMFYKSISVDDKRVVSSSSLQKVGIVTDSICDLPQEQIHHLGVSVVPLRLFLDEKEFVDKVDLSSSEFNTRLLLSKNVRTSQPTPFDFQQVYKTQLAQYSDVLSLHIMSIYSGSYQLALNIGRKIDSHHIHVFDSYTLTAGLGLLVSTAAQYAQKGMSLDGIVKAIHRDRENVRVFVSMDTLDFAVRGGRISKGENFIAKLLRIKPVLEFSTSHQGRIKIVSKSIGAKRSERSLLNYVHSEVRKMKNVRFAITHVGAPEVAYRYADVLQKRYNAQIEYIMDASAVLSIHGGPGVCAVCFLGDR